MAKVVIQGVEYPAPERFNGRELSLIKRVAKLRVMEIEEAAEAGDIDLLVALAMIVLTRAGQIPSLEKLYELDGGEITAVLEPGDPGYEETILPPPVAADSSPEGMTETAILPRLHAASGIQD